MLDDFQYIVRDSFGIIKSFFLTSFFRFLTRCIVIVNSLMIEQMMTMSKNIYVLSIYMRMLILNSTVYLLYSVIHSTE